MNIRYMSDLHMEFGFRTEIPEGDILILAGDIIDGKLNGIEHLDKLCSKFNHVIMVMGNHEHYRGRFDRTFSKLEDELPDNVILLENDFVEIDGQRFIGCSLWSYMGEVDRYFAKVRMNDYKVVKIRNKDVYRKLNPTDTVSTHMQSALYLEENIQEGDIVITHHAPSFVSCNPNYEGNTAYATDLSDMIIARKPSHWIHGHLHDPVDYKIGDTVITSNPHGYTGHENTSSFNPTKEIIKGE